MEPAPVPTRPTLAKLREAVQECHACELYRDATQAVLGEGRPGARTMLVGEQPGDREDREGAPFVGPAGALLDRALEAAGIAREDAYVTNVVKHFRFRARGKRRIHQKPGREHIEACRPWLEAELAVVRPKVLVCLGAVAAQALLGNQVRVTRDRGVPIESDLADFVIVTVHPSSILRAGEDREAAYAAFVHDLERVAEVLAAA
jgi:uracil-DNA glycosylase family protein